MAGFEGAVEVRSRAALKIYIVDKICKIVFFHASGLLMAGKFLERESCLVLRVAFAPNMAYD